MPARSRTLLAGIVVVAAALRFATLDVQSYWFDEATTVHLLRDDLGGLLGAIPDSESTPPLYYVLAWVWTKLFGTGEIGLRSLSALAGTLTVVAVYAVGARWASRRAGLIAAALAATSPLLIWYSQEARSYALLVLFGTLTLVVLPDALEERRRSWTWALLSGLALATHYFAIFVVAPEAIWLLYRWRARVLAPIAFVGAVCLALLPLAITQASNDGARFIREESSLIKRLVTVPKQMLVGYNAPLEVASTVVAGLIALYALYALVTRTQPLERRGGLGLLALGVVGVAVPAIGALAGADYLITRNVMLAWVPLFTALAVGLAAGRRLGIAAALALCAIGVALYVSVETTERYQRDDWRGVADALGPPTGRRVMVVAPVNGRVALEVYMPGARRAAPGAITADEIDLIAIAPRPQGSGRATPPRPANVPPPPDFVLARRVENDVYTILVYKRPVGAAAIAPATLYGMGASLGPHSELVTQPARLAGR